MQASGAEQGFVLTAVLHGAVDIAWRTRRLRLDPDAYLILDAQMQESSTCTTPAPADMIVVSIRRSDVARHAAPPAFGAHLRSMRGEVGDHLRGLAIVGSRSGRFAAFEGDALGRLLAAVVDEDIALRRRADAIASVKRATREELLRRILLAADFIQTHHDEPLSLDDMANAASLSRFHFLRLFTLVHAETPHAYLLRKRTAVARRHLELGGGCGEAAARAGFGSRSALFRSLRKADRPVACASPRMPAQPGRSACCPSA